MTEDQEKELKYNPPSRKGKVLINIVSEPAWRETLFQIKVETGIKQQKLLVEALSLLFKKYGKEPIA